MTKPELASKLADAHGLTKAQALDIVNTTLGAITASVAAGEDVTLHGFGTFKRVHKPGRAYRNPSTGEPSMSAAKDIPQFSPAGAFEDAVKTGPAPARVPAAA